MKHPVQNKNCIKHARTRSLIYNFTAMPRKSKAAAAAAAKEDEEKRLLLEAIKLADAERRDQEHLAQDEDNSPPPQRKRLRKDRAEKKVATENSSNSVPSSVAVGRDEADLRGHAGHDALVSTPKKMSRTSTKKPLAAETVSPIDLSNVTVKIENQPTMHGTVDLTVTTTAMGGPKDARFKRTMLLVDYDIIPTSAQGLLCGFHALKEFSQTGHSAQELKDLTLAYMRENPNVQVDDAGNTPESLAKMHDLDVQRYVDHLTTMLGADASTIAAGCVMLGFGLAVYQRNADCDAVLNLTLSNTLATATKSLVLLFDPPPSCVPTGIGHFNGLKKRSEPTFPDTTARHVPRSPAPSTPTKPRPAQVPQTPPRAVHSASSTPATTPSKTVDSDPTASSRAPILQRSLLDLAVPATARSLSPESVTFVVTSVGTRNPSILELVPTITDITETVMTAGFTFNCSHGLPRNAFCFLSAALYSDGRFNDFTTGSNGSAPTPTTEWTFKFKAPMVISEPLGQVFQRAEDRVIEEFRTTPVPATTPLGKFLTDLKRDTGGDKFMFAAALRGCKGYYPIGDKRSTLLTTVVTPTKRVIPQSGEPSTVDMHIPPTMLALNPVFTYAVATKKSFTPVATSHTFSTGKWVKHGVTETDCFTAVPGYVDGRALLVTAGLSAVLRITKTTGKMYMKVRPGSELV